jgi:hypothetical protein
VWCGMCGVSCCRVKSLTRAMCRKATRTTRGRETCRWADPPAAVR